MVHVLKAWYNENEEDTNDDGQNESKYNCTNLVGKISKPYDFVISSNIERDESRCYQFVFHLLENASKYHRIHLDKD